MKLRFYLRGLGVGIAVTALILMLINIFNKEGKEPEVLLDGQKTLAELNSEQLENMSAVANPEAESKSEDATDITKNEEPEATINPEATAKPEATAESEDGTKPNAEKGENLSSEPLEDVENVDEYVIVTVNRGDGSYTVSSRVLDAGLCDDASKFDAFLMEKGYDKKLQAGNHELKKDMTWDEIGMELSKSVN